MRVVCDSASCRASTSLLHWEAARFQADDQVEIDVPRQRLDDDVVLWRGTGHDVVPCRSQRVRARSRASPRRAFARRSDHRVGCHGALRVGGGDSAGLSGERSRGRLDLRTVAERRHDRVAIARRAVTGEEDRSGNLEAFDRERRVCSGDAASARPPRRAANRYRARRTLRRDERPPRARSCEPATGRAAPAGRSLRARRPARSSAAGERQPLHGGDADAQAGKRAWDRQRRPPSRRYRGATPAARACARPPPEDAACRGGCVAGQLNQDLVIVEHRRAAGAVVVSMARCARNLRNPSA